MFVYLVTLEVPVGHPHTHLKIVASTMRLFKAALRKSTEVRDIYQEMWKGQGHATVLGKAHPAGLPDWFVEAQAAF